MSDFILTNLPCSGRILIVADAVTEQAVCTSGSVVEYRLAKARVAGSNPVSCSQRDRKKSHPMDGSFFYVQALPGSNGSNVYAPLRSSQANVPRTFCDVSCSQRNAKKRRYPMGISFFVCSSLVRFERFEVLASICSSQETSCAIKNYLFF